MKNRTGIATHEMSRVERVQNALYIKQTIGGAAVSKLADCQIRQGPNRYQMLAQMRLSMPLFILTLVTSVLAVNGGVGMESDYRVESSSAALFGGAAISEDGRYMMGGCAIISASSAPNAPVSANAGEPLTPKQSEYVLVTPGSVMGGPIPPGADQQATTISTAKGIIAPNVADTRPTEYPDGSIICRFIADSTSGRGVLLVDGLRPGENTWIAYGTDHGRTAAPGCPGVFVDLLRPRSLGPASADGDGIARFVLPAITSRGQSQWIYFQAFSPETCSVSPVVSVEIQ